MADEQRRILVVDDDLLGRKTLATALKRRGWVVFQSGNGAEALELLSTEPVHMIVTDLDMPVMNGLTLVEKLRESGSTTPILLVTAFTEISNVVQAMRAGADDVMAKPYDLATLLFRLEKAVEWTRLLRENAELSASGAANFIVGDSEGMKTLMRQARAAAQTTAPVLITGESGSGKELLARYLHRASERTEGPFVAVFCGALPEGLVESELFGHVKGAFTGADRDRVGLIEQAAGGTLFFDEVGELSPAIQVKLLRLLQEKEFRRVGSTKTLHTDARILAATHRDLEGEIREGRFREDLYFRLNVVPLLVPSLSERRDDIPELVAAFGKRAASEYGKAVPRFEAGVLRALCDARWDGNIRQLENYVRRLVILSPDSAIGDEALRAVPPPSAVEDAGTRPELPRGEPGKWSDERRDALEDFERAYLDRLLRHVGGNVSQAARLSGKDRRDLHRLLKRWDIDAARYRVGQEAGQGEDEFE